jgi:hypothetical protein
MACSLMARGEKDLGELALVANGGALSAGIALPRDADASYACCTPRHTPPGLHGRDTTV